MPLGAFLVFILQTLVEVRDLPRVKNEDNRKKRDRLFQV